MDTLKALSVVAVCSCAFHAQAAGLSTGPARLGEPKNFND